jgi:hypothetical protein
MVNELLPGSEKAEKKMRAFPTSPRLRGEVQAAFSGRLKQNAEAKLRLCRIADAIRVKGVQVFR